MILAVPQLTPGQIARLLDTARRMEAGANLRVILGIPDADLEQAEWAGILQALEGAEWILPPQRGRNARISDEELLKAYQRTGTIRGTMTALDYYDHNWISKRLRRLGIEPGRPGRRPKVEREKEAG
jgi:hypothetical protein